MAGGNRGFTFGRIHTEVVNNRRTQNVRDFAYGRFRAWDDFFTEMQRIQNSIIENDGVVVLSTGQTVDINTVGGAIAIQLTMETLDTRRETMLGMTNLGLKNENKLWSLQ